MYVSCKQTSEFDKDDKSLSLSHLHTKNITKIYPSLRFTRGAWTIHNFIIGKDKLASQRDRSIVNEGCTKSSQNERIETNDGFNDFESKAQPENTEDGAHWKIE